MANSYKRYYTTLPADDLVTLLTVPEASTAIIRSIWLANPTEFAALVRVSFSPLGSGTHYLMPERIMEPGEFFDVVGTKPTGPLVLEALDELKVDSLVEGVTVVVSALIVDRT